MMRLSRRWSQEILANWGLENNKLYSLDELFAIVEARTGRKIREVKARLPFSPSGALCHIEGYDVDLVFVAEDTNPIHQMHIAIHEIAHVLCGHELKRVSTAAVQRVIGRKLPAESVKVILRSAFDAQQEREAEEIASLILCNMLIYVPLSDERVFEITTHEDQLVTQQHIEKHLGSLGMV